VFRQVVNSHAGFSVDYSEVRSQNELCKFENTIDQPAVFLTAVRIEGVRLIDNVELPVD
jgi:pantothenate synthetase